MYVYVYVCTVYVCMYCLYCMYVFMYVRMHVRTYVCSYIMCLCMYVADDFWYDLAFYVVAILAYLFNINLETKLPLQYILFTLVSTLQVIVLCRHAVVATYVYIRVCISYPITETL